VASLTGVGSRWAQDPPFYAQVVSFETGEELDWSHTRLADWQSWDHDRWIYFHHEGPIAVIDRATGPRKQQAALTWQLAGEAQILNSRIHLRGTSVPADVVMLPLDSAIQHRLSIEPDEEREFSTLQYSQDNGQIQVLSLFLMGSWVNADVTYDPVNQALNVRAELAEISIPLNPDP
jgi:hypothetical protein